MCRFSEIQDSRGFSGTRLVMLAQRSGISYPVRSKQADTEETDGTCIIAGTTRARSVN